jgi:GNAT superfamily N-acetyltransferase
VAVQLRPSTELSSGDLAALFTAAYEPYFVPFAVDEATLDFMVHVFDLDLERSLVAVEDGTAVGLANLGRRGARTWLGGVGVIPSRRRRGIGELLTRGLLDQARAAGATEMALEVIVENHPAISLYEKLGFVRKRELDVLSLAAGEADGGGVASADLEDARALVRSRREETEPWQRSDETLDRLLHRDPAPEATAADEAVAIYRVTGDNVGLVQAAGSARGLTAILASLRARGKVTAVNYPTGGQVAAAFHALGADVSLRQYEMARRLG